MPTHSGRRTIVWGHLILLTVIIGVVVAYILDARSVSLRTNNLLLIQPTAFIALLLAALVAPQLVQRADPDDTAAARRARLAELIKVGCLAGAFGVFVFSLEAIGFDIATFAFTIVGLWICGERKIWLMLLYSALFTVALIYGYQQLVPYPFPLSIL